MAPFGRVLTAMATPFDARGSVDLEQARRLAAALLTSGTDGLVVCGTTGESPTLTTREKLALFEATLDVARQQGGQVIAGTTNYNTAESIELSREAQRIGVHGILATVPYYNNPPQEGLYQHFRAIAAEVDLPLLLYNVPTRTVRNMEAATTLRLARDVANVVGVKEASGNFRQIGDVIQGAPDGFWVWSGDDAATLPMLALGAYGVVSVASHLVGAQIAAMVAAFNAGDAPTAAEIHRQLTPLFDALFVTTSPIPLKYGLGVVGFDVGHPRLPLIPIDPASQAIMDAALAKTRIDLASPLSV